MNPNPRTLTAITLHQQKCSNRVILMYDSGRDYVDIRLQEATHMKKNTEQERRVY